MRITFTLSTLAFTVCALASAQDLPSADDVIAKYYEATGGEEKMHAVKSMVQKGKLSLTDMGMEAAYTDYTQPPNSVNESDFAGMGVVKNGVTDGVTWSVNPFQGNGANKTGARAFIFPLLYWKLGGAEAEVSGEADLDGTGAYKVSMKPADEPASTLYFGKDSGLLIQIDQGDQVTKLRDHKAIDGITVPHTIVQEGGEFNITITIDSIEINGEIPAEKLSMPEDIKALTTGGN